MITPNIWKNNPNVPNHQPVNIYVRLVKLHTIYTLLMVIPFHGNPNKMGILIMYKKKWIDGYPCGYGIQPLWSYPVSLGKL
jgi:hypothetical protein